MRRIRIGIIGAGAATEWAILPALSGPEILQPPDTGAWWGRRPLSSSDIRYQAAARPDIVALCDPDEERAERVASSARIRAVYSDWRLMLREVPLDALICVANPLMTSEVMIGASASVKWLWVDGPPAASSLAVEQLQKLLAGRAIGVWCVPSLRLAWAHRAASRLLERGRIGAPCALTFRWPFPFCAPDVSTRMARSGAFQRGAAHDSVHLSASYAAFDLLLWLAAQRPESTDHNASQNPTRYGVIETQNPFRTVSSRGACVMANENAGATSLLIRLGGGVQSTALFASADSWNAPWPRLEICGTQGRSLVCEGGRKIWLHQPREATEFREAPGLAPHVSSANVLGIAESLKAFLAACADESPTSRSALQLAESVTQPALRSAFHALRLLEAAGQSVHEERPVRVEAESLKPDFHHGERPEDFVRHKRDAGAQENQNDGRENAAKPVANLTLPL